MKKRKASALFLVCTLAFALLLAGCGDINPRTPRSASNRGSSNNSHLPTGKAYTVRGRTYRPYTSANGFTEVGVASWYGPGFHGNKTSNGEKYNQNAMTAAHKLLPFNTSIRVTNLTNGRSTVVRINDRGPFVADRVIDLSRKAADQIGILKCGTAQVRLEVMGGKKPILTPDGNMLGRFYVQIGAFGVPDNARKLMQTVKRMGFGGRILRNENTSLNYVQVGPYPSIDQADEILARLRASYPGLFVVAE